MNAAMIFPLRSKEGIVPLAPSDTNQFGIGKRGNVEGASPNRGYRVLKALRPSEPLAPFVGVLKLGMEAALHFLVAFDSRDHFKGEWRPCVESVSSRIRRITAPDRSEEHTSELQSLMRISYAVFCLTKKKHTRTQKKRTKK